MTYIPNTKDKYVNTAEFVETEDGYHKYVPKKAINRYYKGIAEESLTVLGFEVGIKMARDAIDDMLDDGLDTGKMWNQIRQEIKEEFAEQIKENIDCSFDKFVVSVIDGMSDDEYNKRMKEIYGEEWEAELKKEEKQKDSFRQLVESESQLEL